MKLRLRPAHDAATLAQMYAKPHDARRWPDHIIRVSQTIAVARWMCDGKAASVGLDRCESGADLSCGNGEILRALPLNRKVFGDLAPGYEITGPIEQTIADLEPVDIFIFSETLEHLDDPQMVLNAIRLKTRRLVLSTPDGDCDRANVEHYWIWDRGDVEEMLREAGFNWVVFSHVAFPQWVYRWNIWGCT